MAMEGYQVKLPSSECILRSGQNPYWHIDFATLIREVNNKVGETLFPFANFDSVSNTVTYSLQRMNGGDVLKGSCSLKEKAIPSSCLKKLQQAIDLLHEWADNQKVPQEKRDFCKRFRLPDPKKDPEAYRLTGSVFSRKLHVLWGYQKDMSESFAPMSRRAQRWDDCASRKSIFAVCQGGFFRRLFRFRNFILLAIMILVMILVIYLVRFFPVKCTVHPDKVVGMGVLNYLNIEDKCPLRCVQPECNRHLDANLKCNAHKCKRCGKTKPIENYEHGLCADCFWEVK